MHMDHEGSIPACAGEPYTQGSAHLKKAVYPRVCGGTDPLQQIPRRVLGLSPRVRGNLSQCSFPILRFRSIPACAGEPATWRRKRTRFWVYPRVCGGTSSSRRRRARNDGLSPRVRGNQSSYSVRYRLGRSIPACAGEPRPRSPAHCPAGVYPRVCGGTRSTVCVDSLPAGLSPRVRGNPRGEARQYIRLRSIPACAGEPHPPH